MAQAVELYEADLCPGCQKPRTYSMDADSRGHWHAPDPVRCFSCDEQQEKQKGYAKSRNPQALYFHTEPDEALLAAMGDGPLPSGAAAGAVPDEGGADDGDQ